MESHDVLKQALGNTTAKAVAAEMGVSLSLVYKWMDSGDEGNPLRRTAQLLSLSNSDLIVSWLCRQRGGSFVPDPAVTDDSGDHVLDGIQGMIGRFSELLERITDAADDLTVNAKEASEIRICWDQLKSHGEAFVRDCESGAFTRKGRTMS
jgi:hypothetical protein